LELQLVVLDRLLKATTKKGSQRFEEKSVPPDKILATPMLDTQRVISETAVASTRPYDGPRRIVGL